MLKVTIEMRWKHKSEVLRARYNLCRITGKYPDGTPFRAAEESEVLEAFRAVTALDSVLTQNCFKYHYLQEIGRIQRELSEDYSNLWKLHRTRKAMEDNIAEKENMVIDLIFRLEGIDNAR